MTSVNALTRKIWTGVILLVACLVAGYFAYGLYNRYNESKANDDQKIAQNQELKHQLDNLAAFVKEYESKKDQADILNQALPARGDDLSNFLNNLSQMAQASGTTLLDLKVGDPQGSPVNNAIQVVNVDFSTVSSYPSLRDFVLRLEQSLRLIDVVKMTLNVEETGNIQAQFGIRTYYQK